MENSSSVSASLCQSDPSADDPSSTNEDARMFMLGGNRANTKSATAIEMVLVIDEYLG